MAQGLQAGELVSVIKATRVRQTEPAYSAGLKRIKTSQVGKIIGVSTGHSMIVDFDNNQISLPSRQLKRVTLPIEDPSEVTKQETGEHDEDGPLRASAQVSTSAEQQEGLSQQSTVSQNQTQLSPASNDHIGINYADPTFITAVANRMLTNGNDPHALLIEIRFDNLPLKTKKQVKALIDAKLALTPEPGPELPITPKPGAKRRGRPPTKSKS